MRREQGPGIGRDQVVETAVQRKASGTPGRATLVAQSGGDAVRGEAVQRRASPGSDGGDTAQVHADADRGVSGAGSSLPHLDRIQRLFGSRHDVSGVRAHTGGEAAQACDAIGASAYATGHHVAFRAAPDLHTAAHEAAHVVQQRAGVHLRGGVGAVGDPYEQHADAVADKVVRGESAEGLLDQYAGGGGGGAAVQRFTESRTIPGSTSGFEMDMQERNGALASPATKSGLDGYIRFIPGAGDTNSNTIAIVQIAKLVDARPAAAGADVRGSVVPLDRHARGHLGDPGLRTDEDTGRGVEGGYATDVYHNSTTAGNPLSPRYNFQPAPAGTTGHGTTQQPPQYGGGTGGVMGNTPGFKRSDLPEDIKSATMYDYPGTTSTALDLDFEFQSVARGEDTQHDYGSVNWGFGLRAGRVVNEHHDVVAGASATFREALDRHRDFYVHEPVTVYFGFDRDNVTATEQAKIDDLAGYLTRNTHVVMTLDGFADQIGNAAYNVALSQRRVNNVRTAILTAHPTHPAASVVANTVVPGGGHGISTAATDATSQQPAGTGDQGGNAANGADQSREANRQFNRRVTITFSHPAGTGPAAPGGVGNPTPAPAAGGGGGP